MHEILSAGAAEVATALLGLVTTVVIPYAMALARAWVRAKTAKIEDERLRGEIEHAAARLEHIVRAVVAAIDQVARPAGGRLDPEVARRLKAAALAEVRRQLPEYLRETLSRAFAELDRYIAIKIEQAVAARKAK